MERSQAPGRRVRAGLFPWPSSSPAICQAHGLCLLSVCFEQRNKHFHIYRELTMCQAEDKVLLSGRLQFGWETVHNKVLRKPDSMSEKDMAEEREDRGGRNWEAVPRGRASKCKGPDMSGPGVLAALVGQLERAHLSGGKGRSQIMEPCHGHLKYLGLHQRNEEPLQALSSGMAESLNFNWITGYPVGNILKEGGNEFA